MMTWLKNGVYILLIIFLGFCIYAIITISYDIQQITLDIHSISQASISQINKLGSTISKSNNLLDNAGSVVSSLKDTIQITDSTLLEVNRPCVPGPCGLLSDTAKTLNTARSTFGQIEIAANHENKNLTNLDVFIFFHQHADV